MLSMVKASNTKPFLRLVKSRSDPSHRVEATAIAIPTPEKFLSQFEN